MAYNDELMKYTRAAKAVIYEPKRASPLLDMMEAQDGAINAVRTVMAGIEQHKKIPNEIAPLLAVIILMLLVYLARKSRGANVPQNTLDDTVTKLMTDVSNTYPLQEKRPEGLINQGVPA